MSSSSKGGKAAQLKGFKHSRPGLYLGIGSSAFGALGILRDVKKARGDSDTLKLVNAVVAAVALVTSTALLIRELKQLGDDDVLLG
ncbi:hypothetical protein LO771_11710 [Streptacidiphilus sp. ASG 303]|uniref:hypothetical protein n=1 Tax=Streptacidiphilus sp. ASG 303 TaxID=2896847 RepID=UPI001E343F37|nr:hypothetical protein [Streptacidiphilus sp. ASG 303]MCD0483049.1 hypothetical protein [Streptacidiphilus sp. ASG 303]